VRNALLQGDRDAASALLLSTPADAPDFAVAVLKAALVDAASPRVAPSVAALVAVGRADDAVDLALLARQFADAARLLLVDSALADAVAVLAPLPADSGEARAVEPIVLAAVRAAGDPAALAALLVARRRFAEAGKCLRAAGLDFPALVVEGIREGNALAWVEAPQLGTNGPGADGEPPSVIRQ
jgi:hypothetical protein